MRPSWPWRRGLMWLVCLAPFFYASYGLANHLAAARTVVPSVVFDWEHAIPFWAWTILPYWTVNAFYGASLFVARDDAAVDTQGRRLLTAQIIAVTCFIAFPLTFIFSRPPTDGWAGTMFDALTSFDKPFNQAPSLHIALLVILWVLYTPVIPRVLRPLLHAWFALIGVSVLTTYQHHFIDVPTGALLGWFCVWCWPTGQVTPFKSWRLTRDAQRRKLALYYGLGALACAVIAALVRGGALWLLWPAVSLGLVSVAYLSLGVTVFQKSATGALSAAAKWLLAPYLIGAWINHRAWTRNQPPAIEDIDGVRVGRLPRAQELTAAGVRGVVDLCAELPVQTALPYSQHATLDLCAPSAETLHAASNAIEAMRKNGGVWVCCALGYSRSASAVLTWLIRSRRARDIDEGVALLKKIQPRLVLRSAHLDAVRLAVAFP
jgi:protein-tyrosine phosphatase